MTALLFLKDGTVTFFAFPAANPGEPQTLPAIMLVASAIEVVTGLLMTVGLFTRIAAFAASGEMDAAYWLAHPPQGPRPALNMAEPAIPFYFVFFHLAVAGGGAWALDGLRRQPA